MIRIAIIGAGLSGTLLAINLLRKSGNKSVEIQLIDRKPADNMGPAYSTNEDYLLNVPVKIMGAYSHDPAHFMKWILNNKMTVAEGDFVPRKWFRQYIHSMLDHVLENLNDDIIFKRVRGEVVDMDIDHSCARLLFRDGNEIHSDVVILARGNSQPKNPDIKNYSFFHDQRYIRNPWKPDIFKDLDNKDDILFIGSGQTMADLSIGLYKRGHEGKFITISRHGLLPLAHKKNIHPYPSFFEELCEQNELIPIFQIVRKHMNIAMEQDYDIRSVIDALRPYTTQIWMKLTPDDKRRFLRHVFRYWEIIRSRIPPESGQIMNEMQSIGQLHVLSGKIIDFNTDYDHITMSYRTRTSHIEKAVSCNVVVNCIGPNLDYTKIDEPLIQNLIRKKLIQCDPARLGINALPDGSIIQEDGTTSDTLYTLGPTLKGIVWESIATPEIRVQAENLAEKIISEQ